MSPSAERRLLQAAVALAAAVPIFAGGAGILLGPAMLEGLDGALPTDLDSHFRYLSGLLLGIGIAFCCCIPEIERRGRLFRILAGLVVVGGLARSLSLAAAGWPGPGHVFGLVMELGVVPWLTLWQARLARRFAS